MKREKNIVCVCILIIFGLIIGFTGKVEAKSSTCKHLYGIESKIDHTYHYKKCLYCKNEVKEKHNLDKNGKCYTCKQIHGKGKMTITDGTYHYYTCKNTACRGTIKTKHTWENEKYGRIIKNATCTAKGQLELECTTSGCNKTKKVDIKKKAHNYTIVNNKVDHTYHYKKCINCGASKAEKHTLKNGVCTVCKQVHGKGSMTITDNTYHYYTCKNSECSGTIKTKHTWEKQKYTTIIKEATCSEKGIREYDCTTAGCNEKKTESIAKNKKKHNYKVVIDLASNPDVKVNHTYHYKKCTWCKAKVAEKHTMQGNICTICEQIHGVGEIKKTDTKNHYYKCLNENCTTLIKKAHKYTIVEKTDHKNHYLKCVDCPSIKIEKHNNKGKGKTCSVCGELHTLTVYKTDHEKHYLKCVQNGCGEKKSAKHTPNKKGKCTVCKETHKIISVDKNDGYHIVQCSKKNCTYPKTEEEHVYNKRDSKGRCESCKRFWKNTVIAIQGKLFDLGYYTNQTRKKAVDGDAGTNTIKAINEFLELEHADLKVSNKNDITTEIIMKILSETKTREQLRKEAEGNRLETLVNNEKLMNELYNSSKNKELVNIIGNSKNLFNIVVLMCNYSNNIYSGSNRNTGKARIAAIIKNPPITEEETNKVLNDLKNNRIYFDCSAFASTVMNLAYGIDCYDYSTCDYNPYKDNKLKKGHPFKIRQEIRRGDGKEINYSKMNKGDLLLCDRGGSGHVLVCLGKGYAIHINVTGEPIKIINFNKENDSDYLKTTGKNSKVFVLYH